MNFVSRKESYIVIRQVPFFLLFATAFFSLPFLAFSLNHIVAGTDADGKYFCLFLGLFLLWVFLEFVATRERMVVDLDNKVLTGTVSGVFRHRKQVIDLREMKGIRLEKKSEGGPGKHQYLYIYGGGKEFLLNSPAKRYLNPAKLGILLSEATGIPYKGEIYKIFSETG